MSELDSTKPYVLPEPNFAAYEAKKQWETYWTQKGQPWRTEPEIGAERQKYLEVQRRVEFYAAQCIYPFKDVELSRADVEWLLATHNGGCGPVFWNEDQSTHRGLDLRGAILRNVDLQDLPLAYLHGGIDLNIRWDATEEHRNAAAIHLEGAKLNGTHLEEANLIETHLENAHLWNTHLEKAQLNDANFHGATLWVTHLEGANLCRAKFLTDLHHVSLDNASINGANLEGSSIKVSSLVGATLRGSNLKGAEILASSLESADISGAELENTDLSRLNLEGVNLEQTYLGKAHLRRASFDHNTNFEGARFSDEKGIGPQVGDVHWGDVDLTVVEWSVVKMLKDEDDALNPTAYDGARKDRNTRMKEYQVAVRAYRQLAVVLRNQGLNEDAARFAYRAQLMQRKVYKYQGKNWQFLGSFFLDLLSGYGYIWKRSLLAYLIVILVFATAYFFIGLKLGPVLSPLGSLVFSMTSFHGRGFFPGGISLDDPLTVVAAIEAFVGLLIEVTFIATLTQRLFGK